MVYVVMDKQVVCCYHNTLHWFRWKKRGKKAVCLQESIYLGVLSIPSVSKLCYCVVMSKQVGMLSPYILFAQVESGLKRATHVSSVVV